MASGIGPNLILQPGQDLLASLLGYNPGFPGNPNVNTGLFGQDPMQSARNWMQWGQQGLGVSRGPQSTQWSPGQQWNQINTPTGINGALFGQSYGQGFGQGAYDRFQDSGDSYLRRFGTDVRVNPNDPNKTALQPELDARGNPVGFGQGTAPNPAYYDPNAQLLLASPERNAGYRSGALYGGRNGFDNPLTGQTYGGHREFAGLAALQQGANPYLNDPTQGATQIRANEQDSPFARADPSAYLNWSRYSDSQNPTTADVGNSYVRPTYDLGGEATQSIYDRAGQSTQSIYDLAGQGTQSIYDLAGQGTEATYGMGGRSVANMSGMRNAYEQQLMDQMAAQGSKDLSLGLQDAQSTMASMGLGRSGAGQGTAAGVWRDIQERNATARQNLQAQFAEAGMNRQADSIMGQQQGAINAALAQQQGGIQAGLGQQQGGISAGLNQQQGGISAGLNQQQGGINAGLAAQQLGGMGSESRLQRGHQATMGGLDALTGSLEASRAAERGGLSQGMDRSLQWNLGTQGNYLQSLLGHDQAALNRMVAESQEQSRGQSDYMQLQQMKDQMRQDRLNEMLGLEDRYRTSQNEVMNQMQQYGMLPYNSLMQAITGIQGGSGAPGRTSPWGPMLASAGLQYGGGLINQMNLPQYIPGLAQDEFRDTP